MKFVKPILKPGKYNVLGLDGKRKELEVTPERIKHWADSFTKMRQTGLQIPAPWLHDDSHPRGPKSKDDSKNKGSKNNAGFWEDVWIDEKGVLQGRLDVPREEDSSRIGSTVKEVSPIIRDWTDGNGVEWKDSFTQIALVTQPAFVGQENFKPEGSSKETQPALALSLGAQLAEDDGGGGPGEGDSRDDKKKEDEKLPGDAEGLSIKEVLRALRAVDLDLPDDTHSANLAERIIVASRALASKKKADSGEPGKEEPIPIALGDIVMASQVEKKYQDVIKKDYARRIEGAVSTGRITPAFAKKKLLPLFTGLKFSLADDEESQEQEHLDTALEVIESLPEDATGIGKLKKDGSKKGFRFSFEEPIPDESDDGGVPDDEAADKIANEQLKNAGQTVPAS